MYWWGEAPLQSTAECSSHCTRALAPVGPTRHSLQPTAEDLNPWWWSDGGKCTWGPPSDPQPIRPDVGSVALPNRIIAK
jgi:hypothetical protein